MGNESTMDLSLIHILFGSIPAMRPVFNGAALDMPSIIEILMLCAAAIILIISRTDGIKACLLYTSNVGFVGCVIKNQCVVLQCVIHPFLQFCFTDNRTGCLLYTSRGFACPTVSEGKRVGFY